MLYMYRILGYSMRKQAYSIRYLYTYRTGTACRQARVGLGPLHRSHHQQRQRWRPADIWTFPADVVLQVQGTRLPT